MKTDSELAMSKYKTEIMQQAVMHKLSDTEVLLCLTTVAKTLLEVMELNDKIH